MRRFPFLKRFLMALLILAIIVILVFAAWGAIYALGGTHIKPTLRVFIDPVGVFTEPTPTIPADTRSTDDHSANRQEGAAIAPTATPTNPPATQPTVPTYVEAAEPITFTFVPLTGEKQEVELWPFAYSGGIQLNYLPWRLATQFNLEKEAPEAFGAPISTENLGNAITEMLHRIVVDPWNLTWFRFECYLEDFADMAAVNARVAELLTLQPTEYDQLANEALAYFYANLAGGTCYQDQDWHLKVGLQAKENSLNPELFALAQGDTNHTPDFLIYFTKKGSSETFHSNRKAFEVAARAAGVTNNQYPRVYFNLTEGVTYVYKLKGSIGYSGGPGGGDPGSSGPGSPSPSNTPAGRPTKNPDDRVTTTQAPTGGGSTNPKNSEDPKTSAAPVSTPAPTTAATVQATPNPTPVPTAITRPTENCTTTDKPLKQEDKATQPPAETHNVPGQGNSTKNDGNNTAGGFDPGSI